MSVSLPPHVLDAAVQGDTAALSLLLERVSPSIERQLLRYPVSDEDRRDLLQSTRLQIVRQIQSFRAESSFSTWLFRVTANEALMLMRSRRRHRARFVEGLEWEELSTLPSTWSSTNDDGHEDLGLSARRRDARVRDAIGELPPEYKDVVLAHYHLDLGLQEIADQLRITESAVRSRLHRARSRLRSLLVDSGEQAMSAAA
jgi:RNA polymerase sigma-70 factor (ECF subfamily)